MPRLAFVVTPPQRRELEHARDHEPRPYLRECAAALLKLADGQSARQVALHGLHKRRKPETVRRWAQRYHQQPSVASLAHRPRRSRGFPPCGA